MLRKLIAGAAVGAIVFVLAMAGVSVLNNGDSKPKQPTSAEAASVFTAWVQKQGVTLRGTRCLNTNKAASVEAEDGSTPYYVCVAILEDPSLQSPTCAGFTFTLLPAGKPKNVEGSEVPTSYCTG